MAAPVPSNSTDQGTRRALALHPRLWRDFQYVYPVISRRSKGLSIGINVNIDQICNFDCVYCCVDRTLPPPRKDVDLAQLRRELDQMLELVASGQIWSCAPFTDIAAPYRRLNDLAFSGDGEPTQYRHFDEACRIAAELKAAHGLHDAKIVVITNATGLNRAATKRALAILDQNQGEIWTKLDAGTPDYYRIIDRSRYPFARLLANILSCGRQRPIIIQTLLLSLEGHAISAKEFDAYCQRLVELRQGGCQIALVQLYTIARPTALKTAKPLTDEQLDGLARRLKRTLPGLPVEVYYGVSA